MSSPKIVTRFAPSPTGDLHIGGARTALFNWLFAQANGGDFLLRIEDTDRERSTPEATKAILDGLSWLSLNWDGQATSQFARRDRHQQVALQMVSQGSAYRCYSTKAEIEAFREKARSEGRPTLFQSPWRDANPNEAPNLPHVVRLKAPQEGKITVADEVQGDVTWAAETLDDMILLRSDGTPTYMHAVVVDDHDMGITHIIRGDDHLINAGRQSLIYQAMGWQIPVFAHIPLIHGEDGKKLSKRHGALGVGEYRAMGYMAPAIRNYLARLGWSHGNDELFTTQQAIDWFTLQGIGKSPARLDFKKLANVSAHHIKTATPEDLMIGVMDYMNATDQTVDAAQQQDLKRCLPILKDRSKTLQDVIDKAYFILAKRPFKPDAAAAPLLNADTRGMLNRLTAALRHVSWNPDALETTVRSFAETQNISLGKVAQPLRAALCGRTVSPSVFDMMEVLGQKETLARLEDTAK